jgi:lysophospholipase L1-like esterase
MRLLNSAQRIRHSRDALPLTPVATALIGDSLTTHLLGYNWSPFWWFNGINGGPLKMVANAGISGNTVGDMLARVDNAYTNATPGLAGLGTLGRIIFRGGTNDARASQAWASISGTVSSLLAKLKGYCTGKVIILSVPPVGPTEGGYAAINTLTLSYNAGLAALAAADPARLLFIDDSANLRDGGGAQLSGYFQSDGIHNDGRATWKEGVDAAALLTSELAEYASPLSTDAADIYPARPQWNANHVMAGTGGGGGFTGQVANGYNVGGYGSGFAGTVAKVAADVSDPNQTPWQRVSPTQVGYSGSGEALLITGLLSGRTVTTVDPAVLDVMVEVRFNAFDTTKFKWARLLIMGSTSNQPIMPDLDLKMGGESSISHGSVVARLAMPRISASSESGLSIRWEWATRSAFTGAMGSFDFRCLTVRG